MRTINSYKRQEVSRAAAKLFNDFGELARALFAFFRPVKVKAILSIADNQAVNPPNLNKPVQNNHCTVTIPEILKAMHEWESWDLMADARKQQPKKLNSPI
jgi:hypothetical protein